MSLRSFRTWSWASRIIDLARASVGHEKAELILAADRCPNCLSQFVESECAACLKSFGWLSKPESAERQLQPINEADEK